jgi:hypothetical protein
MRISRNELRSIYSKYKIKVKEVSDKYLKDWLGFRIYGCYNYGNEIYINNSLPNYMKLIVFYHELKHYFCFKNGCKISKTHSTKKDSRTCEIHAIEYSLLRLLEEKRYDLLARELKVTRENGKALNPKDKCFSSAYYQGAFHASKGKVFKKCVAACNRNGFKTTWVKNDSRYWT